MRAKVVIENGETDIVLTPENEFERDIVEKMYNNKRNFNFHVTPDAEYGYGVLHNHQIKINIKEIR